MTIHLCRDFLTLPSASSPSTGMYLASLFMHHVMSFDVDTFHNFNITSSVYTKGQYNSDENNLKFGSINLSNAVFDVSASFSTTQNPNPPWTFGYIKNLTSSFVAFDAVTSSLSLGTVAWYKLGDFGSQPDLSRAHIARMNFNPTSSVNGAAPFQFSLHPGELGEISIARWTAPKTSKYDINVKFYAGDFGETDGYVRKNGSVIFFVSGTSVNPTFVTSSLLASGDIIDVMVGPTGSNTGDTTPVDFIIVDRQDYIVWLPSGSYSGSTSDVNRILALRSSNNPHHNSGLFRILSASFNVVSGTGLEIDYRSPEFPPQESGSLAWRIYASESEVSGTWLSGSNGGPGYNSRGTANNTRIMFNSPSGYQVRLCLESLTDRSGTVPCGFTIAPGAGTVDGSDFDDVEGHLHGPMWFNTSSSLYRGLAVGFAPGSNGLNATTGQWRFTALGDTVKSTIVLFARNVTFNTGGNGWCVFGLPENEQEPLPQKIIERLFVVGYGNSNPNITWRSGFFNDGHTQGMTWSRYGFPMPCIMSSYADIRNRDPHIRGLATAADTPFLGLTELVDVELLGGTMSSSLAPTTTNGVTASQVVPFAARRVGRFPIARQGRSNYAQWALTPDKQWLHTLDGIFVPWAGPHLSGTVTGSSNATLIATSSLTDGTGLQFFEPNPPMADPPGAPAAVPSDKDANRFRKTYSYYRQQVVEVNVTKGGSNPSKP